MKKIILSITLVVSAALFTGCISMGSKLDDKAIDAYLAMWEGVNTHGDPAKAMMLDFKVADDLENNDVVETIKALADEYNMRVTGDVKMYTEENAKADEVKHARFISLCSLPIAKKFLNHSRYFGGFMPCRIMLVEYGNGDRYLVTMDLTLAIYGGFPLKPEFKTLAQQVQKAMTEIPERAAKGDF